MKCYCGNDCALSVDPRNYLIELDGKRIHFEMHRWFGPHALDAHGEPAKKQPGPRHRFWTAVTHWSQQGRKVGDDGLCIWSEPPEPALVHLGGSNYAVAGSALDQRSNFEAGG